MPSAIPANEPREYVHKNCGYTTIMPDEVIEEYLDDPNTFGTRTFCAYCKKQVPDSECTWVETGESLRSYIQRLQREYVPTAGSKLHLKPNGMRRFLAIAIFVLCVIIPVQSAWQDGQLEGESTSISRFGPRLGRAGYVNSTPSVHISWYLWPLAITGSIFSLALYFPSWGFKRYALVCGPVAGIGALMFLSYWLTGRQTIYRFEPVLVAMAGAVPGVAVWALLILRKIERRRLA